MNEGRVFKKHICKQVVADLICQQFQINERKLGGLYNDYTDS